MYKLLIVDDEPLVQVGIRSMLDWSEFDIEICGIAMNGQAAYTIIEEQQPDIVITDVKMPIMTGLELIKKCRDTFGYQKPAFIILTNYEDFSMVKEALKAQVIDYLIKIELTPDSLKTVIESTISRLKEQQNTVPEGSTGLLNLNALTDKFYLRLLHNLFESKEQFKRQAEELHLNFDSPNYICCYLEMVPSAGNGLSFEKQTGLFNGTLQMLREILVKYAPCHIVTLDIKHFSVIFYTENHSDELTNSRHILSILQTVGETIRKYYNVSINGGIGTCVTTPLEIADSFQYARQAASYAKPSHCIFSYEEIQPKAVLHRQFNLSLFKTDLSTAFDTLDETAFDAILSQIIELFLTHPAQYVQILDCACNLLYLTTSLLPDGESVLNDLFQDYPDNYRSLYLQSTTEQVVDWLQVFRSRLGNYMKQHKKEYRNRIVESVKHYIHENIREKLTLNDVADIFFISSGYLSQLFKKYGDMGFNEYVTSQKIAEAKRLLSDGTKKVYEVADMLGFESAFYFSKVFKKVEGISPTEYQNQQL